MMKSQIYLAAAVLLVVPSLASADDAPPCATEAAAVEQMKARDPSLRSVTDPKAKEHIKAAKLAYGVGEFDKAVEAYIAAGLLDESPLVLYNLGQTYRAAKDYEKAIRQYKLFIDRGQPGREVRALVECHIKTMQAELDSAAASAPPTGPAPDGGQAVPLGGSDVVDEPAVVKARPARTMAPWYSDGLGWGLVGAGAVGSLMGGFFLNDAASLDDEASREDRDDVRLELRDKADSRRTWGYVTGGVGVAVLAAGIVRLVLTPGSETPNEEDTVSVQVGARYIGLAARW